jgi:putative FmdB family regulatory protein
MPIFEYICKDCRKRFEALIYGTKEPQCPLCHGTNLDQQISTFSVGAGRGSSAESSALACGSAAT